MAFLADVEKKYTDKTEIQEAEKSLAMMLIEDAKANSKRWFTIAIIILCMWLATIGGFIWYLYQYDFTSYELSTDGGGDANYIGNDGDVYNGYSGSKETN